MTFNPDNFYKFKMAATEGQVQYLLLDKTIPAEVVVAQLVRACVPVREDLDWTHNFPNGLANDYSTREEFSAQHIGEVFENVMFWHDVDVAFEDQVVKRGPTPRQNPVAVGEWLENLLNLMPAPAPPVPIQAADEGNDDAPGGDDAPAGAGANADAGGVDGAGADAGGADAGAGADADADADAEGDDGADAGRGDRGGTNEIEHLMERAAI